ncbi:MAG TPA: GGDEF domain-containing protein [Steroidobacteraceae bacterium]|nr:GGDEF domain-containing protein [Steroidobacteraceae bacterium]
MSETPDWKQKYRDALLEMESEEKRWRQIEQALRRLIGRLCAAGMGMDPQLDDELVVVAAANRRNADAMELEKLAASLTMAVAAVDAVSPIPSVVLAPPATRWDSTCTAARKILQCLQCLSAEDAGAPSLIASLGRARSDAEVAAVLDKTAELIHNHGETLARERLQAAAVLSHVTARLEEVAGYLTESGDEARSRFEDTATVNDTVMSQVREISADVNSATELSVLQTMVNARLETVTKQVLDFRSREESRLLEHTGRAESLRARIADLERETQDLNSKLDREKHGARLDPLTRLANRKSFDERFAQEIHRSQNDLPVAILLWDLDNFKIINDTYGHRAGDRVLQSVATCFMSGLRAEDFVARIGGEEFVILLTGLAFARTLSIADELRRGVEALKFHFRGTPVRVTVSCGLTDLRLGDASGAAFDRADGALYRAKHSGKNACVAA